MKTGDGKRKLPSGWRWARLEAVCKVASGSTPRTGVSEYWDGDIPWVTPTDLGRLDRPVLAATERRITAAGLASCAAQVVPPGTVIMSSRAPIGHLAVAEVACCTNQGCKSFVPTESVDTWYLYFALKTAVPELKALGSGATFTEISKTAVELFEIPVPPLSEQQRIAAILNEQMAAVGRARAAAEEQSQVAKALPTAYLHAVFNGPQAQGWPRKRLGEVCRDTSDGTHFTPAYVSGGVPFLSVKDIRETGISFDNCRYITEEQHQEFIRRCKPERGDVLYTKVGTTGIAKAIDTDREFSIFVSVALLKVGPQVIPEYLEKILNSPIGRTQAANLTQGMANRNLVLQDLKQIEIPVPPLTEQKRIVSILSEQMAAAERTRKALAEQLDTINKLPAALLRRAFSGEL